LVLSYRSTFSTDEAGEVGDGRTGTTGDITRPVSLDATIDTAGLIDTIGIIDITVTHMAGDGKFKVKDQGKLTSHLQYKEGIG